MAPMDEQAEQALIARAKSGDQGAYELLLQTAVRPASRLAFALLHDRSEAEDAFQESAIRAWRHLQNLREGRPFRPWFVGIVANQCREIRRGKWWQIVLLADAGSTRPVEETAWSEGEDLRRAVMRLPHDQRVAVLMHFHLDMPLSDVAIALGLSVGGVRSRVKRALRKLRPAVELSEVSVNG